MSSGVGESRAETISPLASLYVHMSNLLRDQINSNWNRRHQ
jgi:hypothetical protein